MKGQNNLNPTTELNNAIFRSKEESKDFLYYYSILLNRWYLLALGFLLGLFAFYINMRYSKNLYRISGSVLIEDTERQSLTQEAISKQFGFDKEVSNLVEDRIRLLGSTEIMQRVVDSLGLNIKYTEEGRIKKNELFGDCPIKLLYWNFNEASKFFQIRIQQFDSLRFYLINSSNDRKLINYGVPFNFDNRELVIKKTTHLINRNPILITVSDNYITASQYCAKLDISQAGRSNIINVSTTDDVPERGVAIINRLVREYGIASMENKNNAGSRTLKFIDQRINFVTTELYAVEKNVQGFKQDKSLPVLIPEMAKNYIEKTNAVDAKVNELDTRLSFVKSIESIIEVSTVSEYKPLPFSTEILSNVALLQLIRNYNEIITKRAKILESAKGPNPALNTYDEELKSLKDNIYLSIQTIKQEVNDQKERYRQQIIPIETQLNAIPGNEREYAQIMREQGIKQTLFLFLLQKREETALAIAAQVPHSFLLERAVNKGKVSPKPLQMGLFYIFLGLGIPVLFLYLKDLFNDKIHYRGDIDKYLQLPFLGFIPHVRQKKGRNIISDSSSALAESFRLVRSNLYNSAHLNKNKSILVTSTVGGDGKSFVAMNLALTMALTGKKVIALGLDLRKPKLQFYLDEIRSEKGLSGFLNGLYDLRSIIQIYDKLPNLHYVDCGLTPPNPSELMMTDRIKDMFNYLRLHYDYIIVDAAPIGLVADTFLLKEYIDQTVIVLRYNYTSTSHLKFLAEVCFENKLPNISILLNDLKREFGNNYNYGYYSSKNYIDDVGLFYKIKNFFKKNKSKISSQRQVFTENVSNDANRTKLQKEKK